MGKLISISKRHHQVLIGLKADEPEIEFGHYIENTLDRDPKFKKKLEELQQRGVLKEVK